MNPHENAVPLQKEERFLTPGVMVMLGFMGVGFAFMIARFLFGLGYVTNLNNQFPWGIWIGIDVASGVALAAGGFTTGAIAYIFNRRQYHTVIRPALLTAMLGYTFVVIGLMLDIGRYWNITSPMFHWNGNSVLFEVGMCVAIYSTVLYIEFLPIVVERFKGKVDLPGNLSRFNAPLESVLEIADHTLAKYMFLFIIAGVVLSCMHQSGLGSLMLIARYKVHPLWYTPILPLLFLLSAIATGYPMVTVESIIVSSSFRRKPEMEVLTPLARYMPILMGIYLAVKLGDMIVRGTYVYLLDGTYQSNAFIIEVVVGVMLPILLLLFKKVRQSPGWLFFASLLYVLGIIMNRIDVFLVSYTPPYIIKSYFPALGEIAITVGLIATLMFVYRVIVFIFPVLGSHPKAMAPMALILLALPLALGNPSVATGSEVHAKAKIPIQAHKEILPSIDNAQNVFILNSPVINQYSDLFEPVRFMHRKHAGVLKDCTICHHRQPREDGDKYGEPVTMATLRKMKKTPTACSECHGKPFNTKKLNVPGLKGAYHQLCMDCHKESEQVPHIRGPVIYSAMVRGPISRTLDTRAPTDCLSCHARKVPDHKKLVTLPANAGPLAVTKSCLSCHEKEGKALLKTSHWKWQGHSPYTVGYENRIDLGKKRLAINNFCINVSGNLAACTSCHIGYGWKDNNFDFSDMSRIDCLVCHDRTGTYKKEPLGAGIPAKGVDLVRIAQNVGRPDRTNCGSCHFSGGADLIKHAGMNPDLRASSHTMDVHMATDLKGMNFRCQDCHKTRNHMISGRSVSVPIVEGDLSCEYCHTDEPHVGGKNLLVYHLNRHTKHVACQTCHIPVHAKEKPFQTDWDWSAAGTNFKKTTDQYGMPAYEKRFGNLKWRQTVKPVYRWYNGTVKRYVLGDRVNESSITGLTTPMGDIKDPASRIYPFKVHRGKQISDAVYRYLITPKLLDGYWKDANWEKAAEEGMKTSGLKYSGKYKFVKTELYTEVTHEVLPAKSALSCAQCHPSLNRQPYCGKCHQQVSGVDFRNLCRKGEFHSSDAKSDYIDFSALGYKGDPIEVGGRFGVLPFGPECRAQKKSSNRPK